MYECTVCQRTYKTQTSLTRHARNHREDLSACHQCDLCGTSFARRDILTRHHHVAHGDSSQQRKRCHTACEGCRGARTRCDGGDPCRPCVIANQRCKYAHESRRVSRPSGSRRRVPADDQDAVQELAELASQTSNASHLPDGAYSTTHDDTTILPDPFPIMNAPETTDWPAIDLDGLSWPWVHETLFLHDDPPPLPAPAVGEPASPSNPNNPFQLDQMNSPHGTTTPDIPSILNNEIETLIAHATDVALNSGSRVSQSEYWRNAASRLEPILGRYDATLGTSSRSRHILHQAILEQYLPKFNRLWPMFVEAGFEPDSLHPVLYLVVVSIGSMYGTNTQKQFGMALHKSLRRLLVGSLFELENPDGNLVWMAHARLLTQVQGLYFGQSQGFSYAQHLGAILVAQARRLELFQQPARLRSSHQVDELASGREKLDRWLQSETRNRLAFGILRADVYTSVLLNSRPLLSFEEIDLMTPCSDDLWRDMEGMSISETLFAIRFEDRHYAPTMFSDLIRLYLDRGENVPTMRAIGHELCLFGLQAPIWKVSHDPDLFQRMTGSKYVRRPRSAQDTDVCSAGSPPSTARKQAQNERVSAQFTNTYDPLTGTHNPPSNALARSVRVMDDMQSDRDRVEDALESWYHGFQSVRSPQATQLRDTLMSCMLLWHMSYLRLYAPLHQLHDISYHTGEQQSLNSELLERTQAWARSDEADTAASRAVKIFNLIYLELERPVESRARFNFLAFGSLHHAAVVLWTLSETRDTFKSMEMEREVGWFGKMLCQKDTYGLLKLCANLFRMLSPMGGTSFGLAADRLSTARFPARHDDV